MNYFIADTHFGHKNIIKLCNRPFSSLEEMEQILMDNWNRKVSNNDTIYIVGDLFWDSEASERILPKLKGKKVLIVGNHDERWVNKFDVSKHFITISPLLNTRLDDRFVTLCHYPMLEWKGSNKEGSTKQSYLIHGHIHNKSKPEYSFLNQNKHCLNAGVDVNDFEPKTLDELINIKLDKINLDSSK